MRHERKQHTITINQAQRTHTTQHRAHFTWTKYCKNKPNLTKTNINHATQFKTNINTITQNKPKQTKHNNNDVRRTIQHRHKLNKCKTHRTTPTIRNAKPYNTIINNMQ